LNAVLDDLTTGFKAFFSAAPLLLSNRSLLGLSLIPVLGTLALIGAMALAGVWLAGVWLPEVSAEMRTFIQVLVLLLAFFIGMTLYMPIARILLAPFSEALSRKTIEVAGIGWVQFSKPNFFRAIWEGIKLVSLQILIIIVGGMLSFIVPVAGHLVWIVVLVILCGMDYLDVPLSTRGLTLREKLKLLWKYKAWAFGFGLAGYLLLFIPFINLFSLPIGIIGATMLTARMRA
jgi:uncharacterized protein involved in cysteine biosynthesis